MISQKVKTQIERHPDVNRAIDRDRVGSDWSMYPRTVFENVARVINNEVTRRVLKKPYLADDLVLIGSDELETLYHRNDLSSLDDFLQFLKSHNSFRPFTWISGKSLHSYWHGGNPKDKKYNVLLAFIEGDMSRWIEWKIDHDDVGSDTKSNNTLLRKHFLGQYYRFYRKTDGSNFLIKAPFVVKDDGHGGVVVDTKTIGHEYRSSYAAIREGAFYIDCENLTWNERETHIYNIGFESNPEIIMGISNTLDKRKQAMAVANILVRVSDAYDYDSIDAIEIPFESISSDDPVAYPVMTYFRDMKSSNISTKYYYTLRELVKTAPSSVQ